MSIQDRINEIVGEVVDGAAVKDIMSDLFAKVAESARLYDSDIDGQEEIIDELIRVFLMNGLKNLKEPCVVEMHRGYDCFIFVDKTMRRACGLMAGYNIFSDEGHGEFRCEWQDLPEAFRVFDANNIHVITIQ